MQSERPNLDDTSDAVENDLPATAARQTQVDAETEAVEPNDGVGGTPGDNGGPQAASSSPVTRPAFVRPDPVQPTTAFQRPSQVSPAGTPAQSSPSPATPPDRTSADSYLSPAPVVAPSTQPAYSPQTARPSTEPTKPRGLLDMQESEVSICEVDSGDEGRFVLTNQRLIYQGKSSDGALFSTANIADITTIQFGRRARDARSAWWGVIGLLAAIAVWQVTTNEKVGVVAGIVVGGISLLLLADYWFRPAGLVLRFGTSGGAVEGPVSGRRVREAEELAARLQQMKRPARAHSSGNPSTGGSGLR